MAETIGKQIRDDLHRKLTIKQLNEIVDAVKVNFEHTDCLSTAIKRHDCSFVLPMLSCSELAYIARELDMDVSQSDDTTIHVHGSSQPVRWNSYVKHELKFSTAGFILLIVALIIFLIFELFKNNSIVITIAACVMFFSPFATLSLLDSQWFAKKLVDYQIKVDIDEKGEK